jgi:predicted enzyme related to lactoylglutathione lyase
MFLMPIVAAMIALSAPAQSPTSSSAAPVTPSTAQAPQPAAPSQVASPRVVMLRLYVNEIERGVNFYHEVFGANVVQKMGDHVRIMMFPGGTTPGIILIQSPEAVTMHGSFVIQVPDLKGTLDRAAANGGTLKNTHFEQQMAGTPAQSSHFSDPDGNLIEVLQIGGASSLKKP